MPKTIISTVSLNDRISCEYARYDGVEEGVVYELRRYFLNGDNRLYRLYASYNNNKIQSTAPYYVAAKNIKEAKQLFADHISWLKIISITEVQDGLEAHHVLTNPRQFIVI